MPESYKFSCFLMGDQFRLVQCAEILLQKSHQILGVITAEPSIQRWVKEKSLRQIMPGDDIQGLLEEQPFDLFFSIYNFWAVPDAVLTLPKKYAINFHDSPLPRYAGVNATNWAIMNRESFHGVTWHVMTDVIDAGDILKQEIFPISHGESALTLNVKCYEKSIECFEKLMDELAENRVNPVQQELKNRTYFPRWKRPPAACTIDWNRSSEEIDALFRGLDHGSYPNSLGLPKLFLGDRVVIVKKIDILESEPVIVPGTITRVTDETINVATVTREVVLSEFVSFEGKALFPPEFLEISGFREGDKLPKLESKHTEAVTGINSEICKYEDFWIDQLKNILPIEIPYAKRKASRRNNPKLIKKRFSIPSKLLSIPKISENPGDIVMSAFALYLYRIGGKESFDVNFRDVWLKRKLSGTEIFFASHVPLRINVKKEQRFHEFCRVIQKQVESIRVNGSYTRDLFLRDPSIREVFNNNSTRVLPVAIERVEFLSGYQPMCDTELIVVIPDDGKECVWLYDEEVLDDRAIDRIEEQFVELLHDIAVRQDRPIGELSILPKQERQILLTEWHGPEMEFPQETSLANLFEAQVERTPDAEALVFKDERITYRQLNRLADRVAYRLRSVGAELDSLVALCVERSLEMVVGILGILKSGGAYVPLDPAYPKERLAFILEDTQASIILTQEHLKANLPVNSAKIITFDTAKKNKMSEDTTIIKSIPNCAKPENIAYVIYTSGSTGKPKGVPVTHANVMRLMKATEPWYNFDKEDVWTLFHSFAFDFSVWEIFGALLYGGRLVIVPYEISRSPRDFYNLLMDERVTVLNQTPSAFYQLIQTEQTLVPKHDLALRLIIFGGEALELQSLKPWFKRHGDNNPQLVNMYGITETTVHVTYRPITYEDVQSGQASVIGEPIPDLQLYVLDGNLQPVPIGVAGELYVGGAGLALGYLNRPELTKERFIPNPFNNKPGARLYKTGDVARYLPNRDLEYLGRVDQQIQIRGFRVELGEIETVLMQHKNVNQAVVVVHGEKSGDQRLAAYFVSTPSHTVEVVELRKYLQTKLPEYMIPQYFVELESIPLTPNGKVNRRALPVPKVGRQTEESYVAPRNQVERSIAGIWQQLLNIRDVGIHDNFFELGGHSLLLVKMLHKLQTSFNKEFSIVEMFRHPTIAALSDFLTQKHDITPSFATTFDLVDRQKESLKRRKRLAVARRKSHE